MKTGRLVLLSIMLLTAGCMPVRVVSTDAKVDDFSNYRTYGFYQVEQEGPYLDVLKSAISEQLNRKGYESAPNPDLMINIGSSVEEKVQTRETDYRDIAYMGQRNYSWQSEEVIVNQYKEGTVVLDFVDVSSNQMVWQGVAAGTISGKETEMVKRIDKAMEMLFESFPAR